MKRREFISILTGAAAAWPLAARAQQTERVRRIGVLLNVAETDPEIRKSLAEFRQGLQRVGWSEERNLRIDLRFAHGSLERAPVLAKELLAPQPDLILAHTTPVVAALQRETRSAALASGASGQRGDLKVRAHSASEDARKRADDTRPEPGSSARAVPIVFVNASDPVGAGFVASLARPGGNLTGLLMYEASIVGKWLSMLKEIAPRTTRAAFMANPRITSYAYFLRAAEAIAPSLAIELVPSPVETAADIERAIESFARMPNGGLFCPPNIISTLHRDLIIALAAQHRLPAVYAFRFFTAEGGLMSYGIDQVDLFRQAVSYVDRILRGAQPGDLPVQAPVKYETVVNLKTAKALGLDVPPALLVRADEVIE